MCNIMQTETCRHLQLFSDYCSKLTSERQRHPASRGSRHAVGQLLIHCHSARRSTSNNNTLKQKNKEITVDIHYTAVAEFNRYQHTISISSLVITK